MGDDGVIGSRCAKCFFKELTLGWFGNCVQCGGECQRQPMSVGRDQIVENPFCALLHLSLHDISTGGGGGYKTG